MENEIILYDMTERFFAHGPYSLVRDEKRKALLETLKFLTEHHRKNCPEYKRFLDAIGYNRLKVNAIEEIPFFPVRMFKNYKLKSIPESEIFKCITSSGTTGQRVSQIFVDKKTAGWQQKLLVKCLGDFIGKQRLPLLVIDSSDTIKDRDKFAARGSTILGLRFISRETVFALRSDMTLDLDAVHTFLKKYKGKPYILFGFTFMIWQHLYKPLSKNLYDQKVDFSDAYLITTGGWKKLQSQAVSTQEFKSALSDVCGVKHFLEHYGMGEQPGSAYWECECGHLHASIFSDVITRRYQDFSPCGIGERGLIQVVSVIPHSYPGHSLLTEDEGIILGEDNCPCGRKGKYIKVLGRLKNAELRGCSDTYASKF